VILGGECTFSPNPQLEKRLRRTRRVTIKRSLRRCTLYSSQSEARQAPMLLESNMVISDIVKKNREYKAKFMHEEQIRKEKAEKVGKLSPCLQFLDSQTETFLVFLLVSIYSLNTIQCSPQSYIT
jgi:hypothetical protein